ncbi:uncharacterized protein LOC128729182 [Anopheles nili]|uniref:uncharacterized protein LOC128729182 n=1 Tax=Anopheles nili TaxID=185578 RepID=UPI00237BF327|nr:uncharacterized protein LOC128729182 [Anopheles nili]
MLRHLVNVVRYVFQAIRKNIKPLILIVSFVTFVWLIVDTAHRPEFVRHASKHSFRSGNRSLYPHDNWDERSVQQFFDLLEIDFNTTSSGVMPAPIEASCQTEGLLLFTAFAGSSKLENLWHYFSLIALQNSVGSSVPGYRMRAMVTPTAANELKKLFASSAIETIDRDAIRCYNVSTASILNNNSSLDLPVHGNQLFILNNQAKRLHDVLQVRWDMQSNYFRFHTRHLQAATKLLQDLRKRAVLYGSEDDANSLQFVGIHIRADDELPFDYYDRAITFQRTHATSLLSFVVICEELKGDICNGLDEFDERINIFAEHDDTGLDFTLMALCNHTILSNEIDIFPALIRGSGNTVVYGMPSERSQNAIELANYIDRWYTIV